ncbi:response regulator transcription factor [Alkalibacter mobilis]|uniref:response regulator transcription factor n=1 Tax=Alkalibacter mobilis TaxID=2787712 RepID=UPI00189F5417|nr:response regulator transcription factor [Alkalibacter mobilis]MBF7097894.1 response regulator transcription factor [Alkalibacter mobilis]
MKKFKIMVIEDEKNLRNLIRDYLLKEGYEVFTASDGDEALEIWKDDFYDILVLDIMMPGTDGYGVLEYIRQTSDVPAIFLTAKRELEDRIKGFEVGADDYLTKPFSMKELVMRIKAILKRTEESKEDITIYGQLAIDSRTMSVKVGQQPVDLTLKEYELLEYLIKNINIPVAREKILDRIWGLDFEGDDRVVDTTIKRLRKKLGSTEDYIKTIRGLGYKFEVGK